MKTSLYSPRWGRTLPALTLALLLGACSETVQPPSAPPPDDPVVTQALDQLQERFVQGEYDQVIREVAVNPVFQQGSLAQLVTATKLQAFSYCVQSHEALCRDRFTRILLWQPDFTLSAAERGHPQWGPVFESLQVSATAPAAQ